MQASNMHVKYNPLTNEFEGTSANVRRYAHIRQQHTDNKKVGHGAENFFKLETRAKISIKQ